MSRTLQLKGYANTVVANTTGRPRELIIDTTNQIITIHDGVTQGGWKIGNNSSSTNAIDSYARNEANSAYSLASAALPITGGTITGNLSVTGSEFVTSNAYANNFIVSTTFYNGLATGSQTPLPYLLAQFTANNTPYSQINAQNINPNGSIDYIATADVGNDTNFYTDLGIQNSQEYDSVNASAFYPLDGYMYVQGSTINQVGGNLIIGTTGTHAGLQTKILAGGSNNNNVIVTVNTAGANIIGTLNVTGNVTGGFVFPGPYTNDTTASAAGVQIHRPYFLPSGNVVVRMT
jgi:hypothetical protein